MASPVTPPKIYGDPEGVGAFAEALRSRSVTDSDLDIMFKENPAKLLGLDPKGGKHRDDWFADSIGAIRKCIAAVTSPEIRRDRA